MLSVVALTDLAAANRFAQLASLSPCASWPPTSVIPCCQIAITWSNRATLSSAARSDAISDADCGEFATHDAGGASCANAVPLVARTHAVTMANRCRTFIHTPPLVHAETARYLAHRRLRL